MRTLAVRLLPFALAVTALPLCAQNWSLRTSATAPAAATMPRMAFDSARGRCVMFGGWNAPIGSIVFQDTWEWNGTTWTRRTPATVPSERDDHAMVYDAARQRTVMFGGEDFGFALLGETWTWNGTDWTDAQPAHAPSARLGTAMAYDAARHLVVLFGGRVIGELGDTWEWNGSDWTQRAPVHAPLPRSEHVMAFDSLRARTVLFGGRDAVGDFDDTWEYDGVDWTQSPVTAPPVARETAGMVFDALRARCVLYGGADALAERDDTWEFDGARWSRVYAAATPPASSAMAIAYDSTRARTVVFGGFDGLAALGATWEYGGNDAQYRTWGNGCAGSNNLEPALVPTALPRLGSVWRVELRDLAPACQLAIVVTALSDTMWAGQPLPMDLGSLFGMPGCFARTSADVTTALPVTNGVAAFAFAIPNAAPLAGMVVFQQGIALDPAVARGLPLAVSGGGEARLR